MSRARLSAPTDLDLAPDAVLWVFGYGSLMWDPGFPYVTRRIARLAGFHRRFCVTSTRYRGTPDQPGLVCGLDHGGTCRGMLFAVAPDDRPAVVDYLWQREMINRAYRPRLVPVRHGDGAVEALTFTVDRAHPQYCRHLGFAEMAARIARSRGARGPNVEYLANTVEHLAAIGIRDRGLEALLAEVRRLQGTDAGAAASRAA